MNVRGKIFEIYDVSKVSESFRKREFVIEYKENPQYPEYLKFEPGSKKRGNGSPRSMCGIPDEWLRTWRAVIRSNQSRWNPLALSGCWITCNSIVSLSR